MSFDVNLMRLPNNIFLPGRIKWWSIRIRPMSGAGEWVLEIFSATGRSDPVRKTQDSAAAKRFPLTGEKRSFIYSPQFRRRKAKQDVGEVGPGSELSTHTYVQVHICIRTHASEVLSHSRSPAELART